MAKKSCRLYLDFYNDIRSFYAAIYNLSPLTVIIPKFDKNIFASAEKITVKYNVDNEQVSETVKIISVDDKRLIFETVSTESAVLNENSSFAIDYKSEFSVAVVGKNSFPLYMNIAERINLSERNSLASKIKYSLNESDNDSEVTLKYLLEVNRKLDELLAIARPRIEIPDKLQAFCISISADSMIFFTYSDMQNNRNIFLTATLQDSSDRFTFAAVTEFTPIRINSDKSGIYLADLSTLDEDIRDQIIRFIFSRERENLKTVAKK